MLRRPGQVFGGAPFGLVGGAPKIVLPPTAFGADLRNWWRAPDYVPATGNWTAAAGSQASTLGQAVAGKRPGLTAANPAYGNKPTVEADGVDDDLLVAATFALSLVPNTLGILCDTTADVAGDYLVGQYATVSYQFYRLDQGADSVTTDPSAQTYAAAGVATPHLWLFSKVGTTLTLYRDGVSLGDKTMSSSSGLASTFYLFSAGGGYIAASCAELFTIDRGITAGEAVGLTNYFRSDGYPL